MDISLVIKKHLSIIEKQENIRILYATESGSRAWGFPSPDSDYDVRFIYMRPKSFYLKLEKTKDVVEYMLDEELDINGWDIDKTLRLLYKSNPTLFEWINSPIIYREAPEFTSIRSLAQKYFLSAPAMYHYYNMARNNNREFLKRDSVRIKKYFYVLRPILACKWVIAHNTAPPMLFSELVDTQLDTAVKSIVYSLLERKAITSELGEEEPIMKLNHYIDHELLILDQKIKALPKQSPLPWHRLNEMFLKLLNNGGEIR
ncbi:MAG: nucleotidyltransferase domain-containing protein [Christensenellaceae bacterium]|jgi:predicted nucleotidyltransferase